MNPLSLNKLVLSVLALFPVILAFATDEAYKIGRTEGPYTVNYLLETKSSSFVYCTYRVAPGAELPDVVNIKRSVCVMADDLSYKLLNAFNIPVSDDVRREFAYFSTPEQSLNFILEFERFPLDVPFDIVESETGTGNMLNVRDIVVDHGSFEPVDSKHYLDVTPYTRFGMYGEAGEFTEYYSGEDFMLNVTVLGVYTTETKAYQSAFVSITNNSSRDFHIGPESVSATGSRPVGKREKKFKLPLLSREECDKAWFEIDKLSVREKLGPTPTQEVGESLMRIGIDANLPSLGFLGVVGLGAILASSDNTDLTPYMKELNEVREGAVKEYIQPHTVAPGETYSCLVSFKLDNRQTGTEMVISLDGQSYSFIW